MPTSYDYIDVNWHHEEVDDETRRAMVELEKRLLLGDLTDEFVEGEVRKFAKSHPTASIEAVAGPEYYRVLYQVRRGELLNPLYFHNVKYPETAIIPRRDPIFATIDANLSDVLRKRLANYGGLNFEQSGDTKAPEIHLRYDAFDSVDELRDALQRIVREAPSSASALSGFWRVFESWVVARCDASGAFSIETALFIPGTWNYEDLVLFESVEQSSYCLGSIFAADQPPTPKTFETLNLRIPREIFDDACAHRVIEEAFVLRWQANFIRLLELGPDDVADFADKVSEREHIELEFHLSDDNVMRLKKQCERLECSPSHYVALVLSGP